MDFWRRNERTPGCLCFIACNHKNVNIAAGTNQAVDHRSTAQKFLNCRPPGLANHDLRDVALTGDTHQAFSKIFACRDEAVTAQFANQFYGIDQLSPSSGASWPG